MDDLIEHLRAISVNLDKTPLDKLNSKVPRAALICANSYRGTNKSLGPGPVSDSIRVAQLCRNHGIPVYSLYDSKAQHFIDYARVFLRDVSEFLLIYFSGHGGQMKDISGDEDDGMDEVYIFMDGHIVDDILVQMIINNKNETNRLVLLSDCCHSGTIWDLDHKDAPPNCISMAAALDKEEANQAVRRGREFGYFTDSLFFALEKDLGLPPNQIKPRIDSFLKRKGVNQTIQIQTTSPELLDQPLLPIADPSQLKEKKKLQKYKDVEIPPHGLTRQEVREWYAQKRKNPTEQ